MRIKITKLPNKMALGGVLQTHGGDFSTGLTIIGAGGSHETNPNEGVQLGTDQEGTPNLVEEGEVVFNDYVYSKRILADEDTKKQFRLPRKKDISYADIAKRLTKESAERPNDPISQAALQMQMNKLAEQQERQKAEMQEAQAQEAFASLSPDEKQALLMEAATRRQQGAEEQQMAEQAMQEQAMTEQGMQEPSPEEIAMAQQQMMADGSEPSLGSEPEGYAYGGKVNKFEKGGKAIKKAIYDALGYYTDDAFNKWAKDNSIIMDGSWDWEKALENTALIDALGKTNPALAHAIREGNYDFGVFKPEKSDRATIQSIAAGNWENTNGKGWRTTGSTDDAYLQAVEGLSKETIDALTTEQLAERMKKTKAYQDTSKWLQNADNALLYLNTLLNDNDTPEVAKQYARKFVTNGKWKDGFTYDYGKVFGKDGKGVRETNPGTYWHSVKEASRDNHVKNFLIGADGSIQEMVVDVPEGWETVNKYNWQDQNSDWTYNYYKDPKASKAAADAEGKKGKIDLSQYEPVLKKEWPRYAGMLGPGVGLGMQALGIGKPNTAGLDAAVNLVGRSGARASYQPIPDFLRVQPMDMWSAQNRMDANSRATDRSILNSGNMFGARVAGLLANNQNNIEESGNLYRKGLEYNAGDRRTTTDFNRGTHTFNADAYNKVSLANAEMANRQSQAQATLAMQAAQAKMNADAAWNQGIYGNVSGLFKGIGELGRENAQHNMLAKMAASGLFGYAEPENAVFSGLIKRKNSAKKGGKINKRKRKGGLTI